VRQLILFVYCFSENNGAGCLTYIGLGCLSVIYADDTPGGALSLNVHIALSAVPFVVTGVLVLRANRISTRAKMPK